MPPPPDPELPAAAADDVAAPATAPAAPRPQRRGFFRPLELAALAGALSAFLYLRFGGVLHLGWSSVTFIALSVAKLMPFYLAGGIALQSVARLVRREPVRPYLRAVLSARWLLGWGRLWLAGAAMIYAYLWLKVSVPLARPALFDPQLWQLDRMLHFGLSPTIFAMELAKGTFLPKLLDVWYSYFLITVQVGFAFGFAARREDERRNFVLANVLLWVAGAWIYLAVPALGPCYANPDLRDQIRAETPRAAAGQQFLFEHYSHLITSRGKFLASFNPSLGVAAMPSLHVGSLWLFALWARRNERRLFVPVAIAAGLTWAGSLVTAWHYAIDGYAGALLAWIALRLADRWEPVARADDAVSPAVAGDPQSSSNPSTPG